MTPSIRNRIAGVLRGVAPPAAVAFALAILLRFPPEQYRLYPQCPFYQFFHLECPGCGSTRALAALLHGDIAAAMHFNGLFTMLFPVAVSYGIPLYIQFLRRQPMRFLRLPFAGVLTLLTVALLFGISRNLSLFR